MRIVINGGTGLIGSRTVARLRSAGHDAVAASPQSGINSVTGEGLAEAMKGAQAIVDLSNSPSWEDAAVLEFFQKSTGNLLAAAKANDVKHYVALSVVGTDRLQASGYFVAKLAQETLIKRSGVPYTIVHATQFFDLLDFLVKSWGLSDKVVVPAARIQPIAPNDVADVMAEVALAAPRKGTLEIAGPERFHIRDLIAKYLAATGDGRTVETSAEALYSGARLEDTTLVSDRNPRLGKIDFDQWFQSRSKTA